MNECIYFRLKPIEHKNTKHTNTYKERQTVDRRLGSGCKVIAKFWKDNNFTVSVTVGSDWIAFIF